VKNTLRTTLTNHYYSHSLGYSMTKSLTLWLDNKINSAKEEEKE